MRLIEAFVEVLIWIKSKHLRIWSKNLHIENLVIMILSYAKYLNFVSGSPVIGEFVETAPWFLEQVENIEPIGASPLPSGVISQYFSST